MRTCRFFSLVITVLVALAAADAARAAPPAGRAEVLSDKARDLYLEGERLYKSGDYERARAAYLAAWALRKHYQIAGNLGDCEVKLGLYRDAAEHLAYALRESAAEQPASEVEKRLYEQAKARVGTLEITVSEPGADVLVDRAVVGTAPLAGPVFVNPGTHTIEARIGTRLAMADVTIEMGATRALKLSPLELSSQPDSAPEDKPMSPPPPPPPPEEGGPRTALLIAGGATAGAALVAGVILTVVANGKASQRDEQMSWDRCYDAGATTGFPDCAKADELRREAAAFGNGAVWSFIGAGAIGAATISYALLAPPGNKGDARVQAAPMATLGGGGVGIFGQF